MFNDTIPFLFYSHKSNAFWQTHISKLSPKQILGNIIKEHYT